MMTGSLALYVLDRDGTWPTLGPPVVSGGLCLRATCPGIFGMTTSYEALFLFSSSSVTMVSSSAAMDSLWLGHGHKAQRRFSSWCAWLPSIWRPMGDVIDAPSVCTPSLTLEPPRGSENRTRRGNSCTGGDRSQRTHTMSSPPSAWSPKGP